MEQGYAVAKIYVDKAVYSFDRAFDYLIPEELAHTLKRGCRVLVPFGNGNRKRQGMVYALSNEIPEGVKLKPILHQLDEQPVFTQEMFAIAEFMVKNTFCTFYDAVKTILPNAFGVEVTRHYVLAKRFDEEELSAFSYEERNLIQFLQTAKTQKELDNYLNCENSKEKQNLIQKLLEQQVIQEEDEIRQKVSDKTVRMARLSEDFQACVEEKRLTPKQTEVVEFLQGVGTAAIKEIMYFCAVGEGVIKTLEKRGILSYFERKVYRVPQQEGKEWDLSLADILLSDEQKKVFEGILEKYQEEKAQVALLHGVTGSGKTAVFIKLIEQVVSSGKQAMMLVPEISLTPQMVQQFKSLFGDSVAVMHSNLSLGERMDEYQRIQNGKAQIVVGTRSAVFAPVQQLGLIIMDEEGEASYKSDSSPRYHAREIAKFRCLWHKGLLLLASATPSIESYYKAKQGVYHLFTLRQRYASASLPEVYLVDMRSEEKKGNLTAVSGILRQEIQKNIDKKEQTILFINRRGYQTIACCLECGEIVKCPRCDVPLTYHRDNGYMMCHYCGYAEKYQKECRECHSPHVKLSGLGTQKIEDELSGMFPEARILRMDLDTTFSRYSYSEKFDAFRNGDYDILVGTQMIAKGLDFPNVTLVGVLNADAGLYSSDYRGVERVFSLITQVVGRSGRAEKTGRAYIQTMQPENPVISFAAKQDYESFYEDEIVTRKALIYPPFCDICVVGFSGPVESAVEDAALGFLGILQETARDYQGKLSLKVLGPIKPPLYRLNGKYRQKILMKCRFQTTFKQYLKRSLLQVSNHKLFHRITVTVDINGDINN